MNVDNFTRETFMNMGYFILKKQNPFLYLYRKLQSKQIKNIKNFYRSLVNLMTMRIKKIRRRFRLLFDLMRWRIKKLQIDMFKFIKKYILVSNGLYKIVKKINNNDMDFWIKFHLKHLINIYKKPYWDNKIKQAEKFESSIYGCKCIITT